MIEVVTCTADGFTGSPRQLVEHFDSAHPELVEIVSERGQWYYVVSCPACSESHRREIRRGAGADFAEEYREEIRAVGLDILLGHYLGEHVLGGEEGPA